MDNVSSLAQDNWSEICASVREELLKRSRNLKDLDLNQLQTFIYMCDTAITNELNSHKFDEKENSFGT